MGRIEYEYPLFKVYYSNNSNNSNIRGNPGVESRGVSEISRNTRLLSPVNNLKRLKALIGVSSKFCEDNW